MFEIRWDARKSIKRKMENEGKKKRERESWFISVDLGLFRLLLVCTDSPSKRESSTVWSMYIIFTQREHDKWQKRQKERKMLTLDDAIISSESDSQIFLSKQKFPFVYFSTQKTSNKNSLKFQSEIWGEADPSARFCEFSPGLKSEKYRRPGSHPTSKMLVRRIFCKFPNFSRLKYTETRLLNNRRGSLEFRDIELAHLFSRLSQVQIRFIYILEVCTRYE